MNDYSFALFLHIAGALGFFVALGLEWTSLYQLGRATTTEQVRGWLRVSAGVSRVGMPSMVILLISGFYMMATVWGHVAWIIVALGAIVPLAILVLTVSGPRLAAIRQTVAEENSPVSPALHRLLHHPALRLAIQTRVAIALGIVFLMTVKPGLSGSLLAIGVAAGLGLISALPGLGWRRSQEESAM